MVEDTSRRQSRGRQRKSYRVEDEYSFLDDELGSAASGVQTPDDPDEEDGDDFLPDAEEERDDNYDEEISDEGDLADEGSDAEQLFTPDIEVIDLDLAAPTPPKPSKSRLNKKRAAGETPQRQPQTSSRAQPASASTPKPETTGQKRTRGVAEFTKIGGQEVRLRDLYGPTNEDLLKLVSTRDHWKDQETFPEREPGSQRRSFFETPGAWEEETREARQWYNDIGREVFARAQKYEWLDSKAGQKYLHNDGADSVNVLAGPTNASEVRNLPKLSYFDVGQPFKDKKDRRGWLINLGSRIQDTHWASIEDGNTQYLAIAVEQKGTGESPGNPTKPPAFSSTERFPASIQIWAFGADKYGQMDVSQKARLHAIICTEWGAPKQIRWCPIDIRAEPSAEKTADEHIGLLATIWSDGNVRLLDITTPKSNPPSEEAQYMHVKQAAFDVSIPQTIPTCLRWLSGTTFAVATAAGTLAIWTLTRPDTFSSSGTSVHAPKPWFYQQMADTYIITLSSGWPSQPQFISLTTADGFARLYDIRTPSADNTTSARGRTLCLTQDWHEHTQSFVMPDEHYMIKHNPIRRFYHNLYSMRAESSITTVAASPVHPGLLMGGADGRVETTNPVARIANYKIVPWQHTWFVHEWRGPIDKLAVEVPGADAVMAESGPTVDMDDAEASERVINKPTKEILSNPLVRITEGYKAFQPGIQHSVMSKKPANPEVNKGITVYEEKSAITALAWNPNVKFGTWAVAGMGSGLLRVEDVGV